MKKHIPLVVGNWKMNPVSQEKAEILCKDVLKALGKKYGQVEVGFCPPTLFMSTLAKRVKASSVFLGAQDVSSEKEGAHTGEVSAAMLKLYGVTHTIVGHSERRAQGESDSVIAKKALASASAGLTTIVCVGEKVRDGHGHYFNEIEAQLKSLFSGLEKKYLGKLVIAYEPVWAIGTGKTASVEDVHEMKLFIQKIIAEVYERSAIAKVRIIYGGSVNKDNAKTLTEGGDMNGFLVGGASLKPAEFAEIISITNQYGK
jgi:triosephosphate isomerase